MSETLNDEDESFIGIPLQSRILAECFQSNIEAIIRKNRNQPNAEIIPDAGKLFDLAPLYNRLMGEKKRAVFLAKQTQNIPTFSDEKEFLCDSIKIVSLVNNLMVTNCKKNRQFNFLRLVHSINDRKNFRLQTGNCRLKGIYDTQVKPDFSVGN